MKNLGRQYLKCAIIIIFIITNVISTNIFSQNKNDSLNSMGIDTTKIRKSKHSPKIATIMSACLPGLGQVYNRQYWKVPVIYALGGTAFYFININYSEYNRFKNAYTNRVSNPDKIDNFPNYTEQNLMEYKNYYRRNFEFSCVLMGALYLMNVLDATVYGYLYKLDLDENLSLNLKPTTIYCNNLYNSGLKLTLKF